MNYPNNGNNNYYHKYYKNNSTKSNGSNLYLYRAYCGGTLVYHYTHVTHLILTAAL